MNETRRREVMQYPLPATATFTVRCDPPYESMDGGSDELLCKCKRDEVRETITDLIISNLARLASDQAPMLIEVRRTS